MLSLSKKIRWLNFDRLIFKVAVPLQDSKMLVSTKAKNTFVSWGTRFYYNPEDYKLKIINIGSKENAAAAVEKRKKGEESPYRNIYLVKRNGKTVYCCYHPDVCEPETEIFLENEIPLSIDNAIKENSPQWTRHYSHQNKRDIIKSILLYEAEKEKGRIIKTLNVGDRDNLELCLQRYNDKNIHGENWIIVDNDANILRYIIYPSKSQLSRGHENKISIDGISLSMPLAMAINPLARQASDQQACCVISY